MPTRYVLSPESADAVRNLVAARGGVSFSPRRVVSPPGSASVAPRPFDVRFGTGVAADGVTPAPALFCYLPNWIINSAFSVVRADETPVVPAADQPIGTAADPWVQIATASASGTYRVFLGFLDARETDSDLHAYRWRLWAQSGTGTVRPSGFTAAYSFPFVFIARVLRGAVEQLVDGAIHIARQWVQQFQRTNEFCLYDSSGAVVLNLDTATMPSLTVNELKFENGIRDAQGNLYQPRQIVVDDVPYTVLAL